MKKENVPNITYGVLYPGPPKTEELRKYIEDTTLDKHFFPVYWYYELIE